MKRIWRENVGICPLENIWIYLWHIKRLRIFRSRFFIGQCQANDRLSQQQWLCDQLLITMSFRGRAKPWRGNLNKKSFLLWDFDEIAAVAVAPSQWQWFSIPGCIWFAAVMVGNALRMYDYCCTEGSYHLRRYAAKRLFIDEKETRFFLPRSPANCHLPQRFLPVPLWNDCWHPAGMYCSALHLPMCSTGLPVLHLYRGLCVKIQITQSFVKRFLLWQEKSRNRFTEKELLCLHRYMFQTTV